MTDLLKYNAFGLVTISRQKVTASLTSVYLDKSISRSAAIEFQELPDGIASGEIASASVGVWFEMQGSPKVTMHEIKGLKSGLPFSKFPEVGQALAQAVEMIRRGMH